MKKQIFTFELLLHRSLGVRFPDTSQCAKLRSKTTEECDVIFVAVQNTASVGALDIY